MNSHYSYRIDGRSKKQFAQDINAGECRAEEFENKLLEVLNECLSRDELNHYEISEALRDYKHKTGIITNEFRDDFDFSLRINKYKTEEYFVSFEVQFVPDILSNGKINTAAHSHIRIKEDTLRRCLSRKAFILWAFKSNNKKNIYFKLLRPSEIKKILSCKAGFYIGNKPAYRLCVFDYSGWISLSKKDSACIQSFLDQITSETAVKCGYAERWYYLEDGELL